ncbi:MAG: hypothetical protein F7C07_00140 [Desulfurococcales archaeon]|nr:hypothetical protein [Desulfurococcales archaeon]
MDWKGSVMAVTGVGLLLASFYFFLRSLDFLTTATPNVTASLLSALIGFSSLSAGVSILRSWAISRAAEKQS